MSRIPILLAAAIAFIPLGTFAENPVVPKKSEPKKPAVIFIEATETTPTMKEWGSRETAVRVGDVVEWHVKKGTHGVMFKDWGIASKVLKIDKSESLKIGTQPGIPSPEQGTVALTAGGDRSRLLVRATIQAIPLSVHEIDFFCTRDGEKMSGKLLLRSESATRRK